jgi:hypothetical protein
LLVAAEPGSFTKIVRFRFREPSQLATGAWNRAASNHLRAHRDKTGLGHCNFQFYGNAAWHYFSLAALLFEASDVGGTGRNSLG